MKFVFAAALLASTTATLPANAVPFSTTAFITNASPMMPLQAKPKPKPRPLPPINCTGCNEPIRPWYGRTTISVTYLLTDKISH